MKIMVHYENNVCIREKSVNELMNLPINRELW